MMQHYIYDTLTPEQIRGLLKRPSSDLPAHRRQVEEIFTEVRQHGDSALRSLTERFDGMVIESLHISPAVGERAWESLSPDLREAIETAKRNIQQFHERQIPATFEVETSPGLICRREWRPVERVGLYIPGGSAPLVSTVLMLGVPALLAGCSDIVLCSPPPKAGPDSSAVFAAAWSIGIRSIFAVGGAQAIAAMAIGTGSIPKVEKIFGPGNLFVLAAKALASRSPYDVPIDMPAGPTELLIIADEQANPRYLAADLISQAEHGEDSHVVLVSTSTDLISKIRTELTEQLDSLPRSALAAKALSNSFSLQVASIDEAIGFSNQYAPEHLILAVNDAEAAARRVTHAGSVFLGSYASVVFGDYVAGTNHTLPTGGFARAVGGLTVESFMKPVFFQTLSARGAYLAAPAVATLARAEGLEGHARAAEIRGGNG